MRRIFLERDWYAGEFLPANGVLEGCLSLTMSLGKGFKETLLHMPQDVFRTIEDRCLNHTSEIWRSRWLAESSNEGSEREAG